MITTPNEISEDISKFCEEINSTTKPVFLNLLNDEDYDLKEDTTGHYELQLNLYNFLLRKNGYETEDYAFLLFYIPKAVLRHGEILFDTKLVKMKVDTESSGKIWNKAIKLLNSECPNKSCEWCEGR